MLSLAYPKFNFQIANKNAEKELMDNIKGIVSQQDNDTQNQKHQLDTTEQKLAFQVRN